MGDAENALPSSKKRVAGRELSRDNSGLDNEEDTSELETETFKRASDEVLATRRIVKVRRQQSNSPPSSYPFSSIRLVAPSEPSSNVTAEAEPDTEKTVSDDARGNNAMSRDTEETLPRSNKQSECKTDEAENKPTADEEDAAKCGTDKVDTVENAVDKEGADTKKEALEKSSAVKESDTTNEACKTEADDEQTEGEDKTETEDKKEDRAETEELNSDGAPLKSFQQLSSTQNAFTGLAGTGFSSSSFTFGTFYKEGSALGSNSAFGFGLSNNGNSVFGASGAASAASKNEISGFPGMREVPIETGEENETVVFTADSVLFEFVDGTWKERGKGELKVNVTTTGTSRARVLMRARGNYRLLLNASLYPDMKLTNMDKKGITFACINSACEGKDGFSTFALKFKDVSMVEEFRAAIMAHKDKPSRVLRSPENSPKAPDY